MKPEDTLKQAQRDAARKPVKPDRPLPIDDPNPPDAQLDQPLPEEPKVGSRDAPGG